jgi:hypothetical protein
VETDRSQMWEEDDGDEDEDGDDEIVTEVLED